MARGLITVDLGFCGLGTRDWGLGLCFDWLYLDDELAVGLDFFL